MEFKKPMLPSLEEKEKFTKEMIEMLDQTPDNLTSFQLDMINRFSHHAPKNESTAKAHTRIREECLKLSSYIDKLVPPSREKSLALTKLEEVMMWANAGIARNSEDAGQSN